jgi:hypothetical protein
MKSLSAFLLVTHIITGSLAVVVGLVARSLIWPPG